MIRRPQLRRPILSGFPSHVYVKLRYVTEFTLDAAIGGAAQRVFRANSLFDPDVTGIGHQPMGFDQWAEIYSHYTVLGSKMTLRLLPADSTNYNTAYWGILLDTTTNGTAGFSTNMNVLESKLCSNSFKIAGNGNQQYNPDPNQVITKYFSAKKFFGQKNIRDGSANSAEVSANPSNEAYLIPFVLSAGGNDPGPIQFTAIIDYIAMFRDPVTIDGS
jgi:hypothetical protein